MAGGIHDSITKKILPLGDGVIVCPAHGAGSVCGSEIADHPFTTVGYERKTNPLLKLNSDTFVAHRISESPYFPPYFHRMDGLNLSGAPAISRLPIPEPLPVAEVNWLRKSGCQLVDIRSPTSFATGHIPVSLSIWRNGITSFSGWFLNYTDPIVLIDDFNCDPRPVITSLRRLGYDRVSGFLAGGFGSWFKAAQEIGSFPICTVQELHKQATANPPFMLEVRDSKNREGVGYIRGSHRVYIGELSLRLEEIPKDRPVYVFCDAGYKGSLAASILAMNGYRNATNVIGGITTWKNVGFPLEK